MQTQEKILDKIFKIKKELKNNPKDSSLYLKLGKQYLKLEDFKFIEDAINCYKKAYKLNKSSNTALKIANLYMNNANAAYAYKYYLKAIKLSPENEDIIFKAKECAFEYYLEDYIEDNYKNELEEKLSKHTKKE